MEYCKGENLRTYIDKHINDNTFIQENIISNIIRQICRGIKEMYNMKIVHRDLKPENIFIDDNTNIKIGDFGISKQLNMDKTHILTTKKLGSEYNLSKYIQKLKKSHN